MHLVDLVAFACTVLSVRAFRFPDFVPLHRRQDPGTPAYDCHADCGDVIITGRTDGYCDSADFKTELSDCLKCAVEYDIWKYYGDSVSTAAAGCGLDATLVEVSFTETATTASHSASAAKPTENSLTSAVPTDATISSTHTKAPTTSVSPHRVSVSSRPSSLIASTTPTGSSATSTPSPSPLFSGGTSINNGKGLVSDALIGCIVAAFI
ncbi:hypothetical protein N7475_002660 [Penicillium sp. IBT 31633x]|nr:hypothetical protein N7475_002660 [Penicillium sp. IBT 31633x]